MLDSHLDLWLIQRKHNTIQWWSLVTREMFTHRVPRSQYRNNRRHSKQQCLPHRRPSPHWILFRIFRSVVRTKKDSKHREAYKTILTVIDRHELNETKQNEGKGRESKQSKTTRNNSTKNNTTGYEDNRYERNEMKLIETKQNDMILYDMTWYDTIQYNTI